ncbi:hypothetical protein [Botrimarina hoheduenensis]|uniref:[acyl-carrier-protein] S-malonyltransferase n=1 Tax=Botrimarina hoheduenensis TaxID=2528000 RepID=A0A5C5WFL5_9BACT|nr:hypothetical protein [Botrimarina hoheduenensis]TWT48879.1 hypothetical protein Pla111_06550 [Botrimarina hoheduenensis]
MTALSASAPQFDERTPTVLAYRGYNQTNLGRTRELLQVPAYTETVSRWLRWAERLVAEQTDRPIDLIARVERSEEPAAGDYAEAIALVFAVEMAQVELARTHFKLQAVPIRFAFGYSLGELAALAAGGLCAPEEVLRIPLKLAADCEALAQETTMAVLFSRTAALPLTELNQACEELSCDGRGTIAVSAILSPNTALVIGQGDLLERLQTGFPVLRERGVRLRKHDGVWPPLHTPIVRQRAVPDRASCMIEKIRCSASAPSPDVFSLVTGTFAYGEGVTREVLRRWTDQPQRLWSAVVATLASDARRVIHVGPAPNVIPATFQRLAENVRQQTGAATARGLGLRAVQSLVERPWLAARLPTNTRLLRAPQLQQIVLEDWLLDHAPDSAETPAAATSLPVGSLMADSSSSVANGSR